MGLFRKKAPEPAPAVGDSPHRVLTTDAGLIGLFSLDAFAGIHDEIDFERELLEDADRRRHVAAGHCAPIFSGFDGAYAVDIRVGTEAAPAALTDRERAFLTAESDRRHRLVVGPAGAEACGVEQVGPFSAAEHRVPELGEGTWSVHSAMIRWDAEPGCRTPDGSPSATTLPDFVVLVHPASDDLVGNDRLQPFPQPPRR